MKNDLLTEDEWSVLDKIGENTSQDYWFYLRHDDERDIDYIYDLISDRRIGLADGIRRINESLPYDVHDFLNDRELETYENTLKRFGI